MSNEHHKESYDYADLNDVVDLRDLIVQLEGVETNIKEVGGEVTSVYIDNDDDIRVTFLRPENKFERQDRERLEEYARRREAEADRVNTTAKVKAARAVADALGYDMVARPPS